MDSVSSAGTGGRQQFGGGRKAQSGEVGGRTTEAARAARHNLGEVRSASRHSCYKGDMSRSAAIVLYVLGMVAVIVAVDVLVFRHHFWARLMANVGIVLVFGAFYVRYLKR